MENFQCSCKHAATPGGQRDLAASSHMTHFHARPPQQGSNTTTQHDTTQHDQATACDVHRAALVRHTHCHCEECSLLPNVMQCDTVSVHTAPPSLPTCMS